jgi:hypothetical protein
VDAPNDEQLALEGTEGGDGEDLGDRRTEQVLPAEMREIGERSLELAPLSADDVEHDTGDDESEEQMEGAPEPVGPAVRRRRRAGGVRQPRRGLSTSVERAEEWKSICTSASPGAILSREVAASASLEEELGVGPHDTGRPLVAPGARILAGVGVAARRAVPEPQCLPPQPVFSGHH